MLKKIQTKTSSTLLMQPSVHVKIRLTDHFRVSIGYFSFNFNISTPFHVLTGVFF
jgi:hypothetical protein